MHSNSNHLRRFLVFPYERSVLEWINTVWYIATNRRSMLKIEADFTGRLFSSIRCEELKLFGNHVRFYWQKKSIFKKKFFSKEMNLFATKRWLWNYVVRIHCHEIHTIPISLLSCYFSVIIHFLPFSKSLFHFMTVSLPATDVYIMRTLNTIFSHSLFLSMPSLVPQSHSIHAFTNKRTTTQRKKCCKNSVEWKRERKKANRGRSGQSWEADRAEKRAVWIEKEFQ